MSLVVPNARELTILTDFLTPALTLRLYSNNRTPAGGDVAADYTEVTGGGYASKSLTFANWTLTAGTPTVGVYNAIQEWNFTGATGAPSTIYGYYVIETVSGLLKFAERFPSGSVPFTPVNGSIIRVLPRFEVESQ
jgi:hypothetical protein